jgi:methionine synthase I (cobalamin-dependent)
LKIEAIIPSSEDIITGQGIPKGIVVKDNIKNLVDKSLTLFLAEAEPECIISDISKNDFALGSILDTTASIAADKSVSQVTPVMATMTFDKIPKGYYTIMGVNIEKAVEGLTESGADIIGSNCGHGIDDMIEIARQIKNFTNKPVIIQSNAGLPKYKGNELVYHESPSYFAEKAVELIEAGVSIIGGCCGTTPEHISAIRKVVDSTMRIKT